MLRTFLDYLTLLADAAHTVLTTSGPQRWRRLRFLLLFWLLFPWIFAVGQLTMALDHLLFPGFRDVKVQRPIFIVGQPRTGTTYLYRTLAKDTGSFTCFRFIDFLFPSIVLMRCADFVAAVDRAVGAPGLWSLQRIDAAFLPDFAQIHRVGILEPEEDEYLLYHTLCSGTLWLLFPTVRRFRRLLFLDTEAEPAEQRWVMERYRALVKRRLYHCGPHTTLLSKNPWFTGKLASLERAFPGARFVKLDRSPLQAIPSSASMVHFSWHNTGALPPGQQDIERVLEIYAHYDRHARAHFTALGPGRAHSVPYAAFVADPQAEIRQLCGALDLTVSPALSAILDGEAARQRKRKSGHSYSLEDWGLSEAEVAERFPEAADQQV
jgi:omega-hydroxy-beta-dihydromenaquinone-9 sulfotransferase